MAYGEKYYHEFGADGGDTYRANLLFRDYSGGTTELDAEAAPLFTTWGRRGSDIFTPFLASHSDLRAIRRNAGDLTELATIDAEEVRLEILKNSSLYWLGKVETDIYEDSTQENEQPEFLSVSAWDSIGQLKSIAFEDTTGSTPVNYEDRDTMLGILVKCLQKLGLGLDIYTASWWRPYNSGSQYGSSTDPLSVLEVEQEIFYGENGRPFSCYTVVDQILRRFALQLYQSQGAWHITQRELYIQTSFTRWHYDSTGSQIASESYDPRKSYLSPAVRTDGRRSYRDAYGEAAVLYLHEPAPNLIKNGDMERNPSTRPIQGAGGNVEDYDWEITSEQLSNGAAYVAAGTSFNFQPRLDNIGRNFGRGRQRTSYVRQRVENWALELKLGFDSDWDLKGGYSDHRAFLLGDGANPYAWQVGDYVSLNDKVSLGFEITAIADPDHEDDGPWDTLAYVQVKVGSYWLQVDGTWTTSEEFIPVTGDSKRYLYTGEPYNFFLVSTACPTEGNIEIRLRPNWEGKTPTETDSVRYDDVDLRIVDDSGNPLAPQTVVAFYSGAGTAATRDLLEVIIGQGPARNVPNRIVKVGSVNSAEGWKRGTYGTSEASTELNIDEVHASVLLRAQSLPLEARYETYRFLYAEVNEVLDLGVVYAPVYLNKNYRESTDQGEWVRVREDGVDPSLKSFLSEDTGFAIPQVDTSVLGETRFRISQTADFISNLNPVAETIEDMLEGDITEIPVTGQWIEDLMRYETMDPYWVKGQEIILVNSVSGRPVRALIREDGLQNITLNDGSPGVAIFVEFPENPGEAIAVELLEDYPAGSMIYPAWTTTQMTIRQMTVGWEDFLKDHAIGTLAQEYGSSVASIDLKGSGATVSLESGDWIFVYNKRTGEYHKAETSGFDVDDTTISFTSSTFIEAPEDAVVIGAWPVMVSAAIGDHRIKGEKLKLAGALIGQDDEGNEGFIESFTKNTDDSFRQTIYDSYIENWNPDRPNGLSYIHLKEGYLYSFGRHPDATALQSWMEGYLKTQYGSTVTEIWGHEAVLGGTLDVYGLTILHANLEAKANSTFEGNVTGEGWLQVEGSYIRGEGAYIYTTEYIKAEGNVEGLDVRATDGTNYSHFLKEVAERSYTNRWPSWSEVTSKPNFVQITITEEGGAETTVWAPSGS